MADDHILQMLGITKEFPGVKALDDVRFDVSRGEIHALIGENGAGKSTLMNVLSGVYPYGSYEGKILYNGEECQFKRISDSEEKGIGFIHQELALFPYLSIAENVFMGNETARNGIIDWNECLNRTVDLLKTVGLHENPHTLVGDIGIGKRQLVEIAKALSRDVKLLILDEPTSALNDNDSLKLLDLLVSLKDRGITCIMISHKLNEIVRVADSITILRDGKTIETLDCRTSEITEARIIKGMVGRELLDRYPARTSNIGSKIFEVRNWTVYHEQHVDRKVVDNVSFHVRRGEVVGIAGLMGAGRTELAMSIFGRTYGRNISGEIYKDDKKLEIRNVADATDNGLAYVSEDRKTYGLVLINDIKTNITLTNLASISSRFVIDKNKEVVEAKKAADSLRIKCTSILQQTGNLSGGNQQKVVLAKWIFKNSDVLILDEPTRGIDVGAKYEVCKIINDLVAQGKGVVVISSELPEILGMCDRIYVMSEGEMRGEMLREDATQEELVKMMIKTGA